MTHRTQTVRASSAVRPRRTTLVVAVSLAFVAATLTGCSSTPRSVLNVPGSYVADLWQPTIDWPSGGPTASVLMCLDEESAVHLETGPGSSGGVGSIRLEWAGTTYTAPSNGSTITYTTPVLQPGCGMLTFGVDCCHVDHYLAIQATKV